MVQIGDPLGNGMGRTSIRDGDFEDKFATSGSGCVGATLSLDFDFEPITQPLFLFGPYMVNMANAGPNKNDSHYTVVGTHTCI